jgi:hypothetical protein
MKFLRDTLIPLDETLKDFNLMLKNEKELSKDNDKEGKKNVQGIDQPSSSPRAEP